jgi:hypothetical protein
MGVLFSEGTQRTEISLFNTISLYDESEATYIQGGQAQLSFGASGYKNIKADIAFNFNFDSLDLTNTFTLDRLSLKGRFPSFTLLAGKTRLDWGEGVLFNAGNALFNDTSYQITLDRDSHVSDQQWLTSVKMPLGYFSFIEAAVVAPPDTGKLSDTTGGVRYYNSEGDIKYEVALSITNDETGKVVTPSASISGSLGIDAYLTGSFNIPYPEPLMDELKDSLVITAGAFHLISFENQSTLSMRLETLLYPFASFTPDNSPLALFLYPSIQYSLANNISFSLQSIVSVIDASASVSIGGSWSVFDGLTLFSYLQGNIGEEDDTFSFIQSNNNVMNLSIGFTSLF